MNCQSCVQRVQTALQAVAGVERVTLRLEAGRAMVHWKPDAAASREALVQAVKAAGYEARLLAAPSAAAPPAAWSPLAGWRFNVVVGLAATVPLMIGDWLLGLGMTRWFQWLGFGLALPVQILGGARFYRGAWHQLRQGRSNMDALVALGSTTAFGYSAVVLFSGAPTHLYFMEAAAIITLISVGHWLESLASARATSALQALLHLAPATARRLDADGSEVEVPVAELRPGDVVLLKPGDRVPTDGEVTDGRSAVNEAMLTGESLPAEKNVGARLYGGTVNLDGALRMRVTAVGEATALAQIVAVVERAQSSRANIQKLGDQVSNIFVPVVVLVALATGLGWALAPTSAGRLTHLLEPFLWPVTLPESALATGCIFAAAVLIVACPCAMGLATPAAIMAGTNAAARHGILIRDGAALEKSGRITAVVFDKTGTLTRGNLDVAAIQDLRAASDRTPAIEVIAANLARFSNHPISQAVARLVSLESPPLPLADWQEFRGCGVQARANFGTAEPPSALRLGALRWLEENGVETSGGREFVEAWSAQGATILGLAAGERLVGLLALRDELKPHASDVVARLSRQAKAAYLITGDNRRTALAVAAGVGIAADHVFAEIRPERKAAILEQLQQRGERVAFVGDGINDAPALEQADLGIAVGRASDVAREAADIILLKSDLAAIPESLGLAQATLRTIKQNLFWAFFYNALAVPLAALGFLSPVLCAAAMGVSDLIVIGNALRLRRWKLSVEKPKGCG
ncbi:MAG: cation-translocating P-type ATPase [Verrucomicrobia bacterium]|nr:cation-translocating P-type ATPase [Verrucomicrobiota bacterium]